MASVEHMSSNNVLKMEINEEKNNFFSVKVSQDVNSGGGPNFVVHASLQPMANDLNSLMQYMKPSTTGDQPHK